MARAGFPFRALILAAATSGIAFAGDVAAPVDPPAETTAVSAPIAAEDAGDHVGEECVVEMVVRAARALADKDVCFLNSRRDRRDEDNFTAVIFKDGLERFRAAGIENPALHYLDRRIHVRGTIREFKERPEIVVTDPAQIELVEEPADAVSKD